MCNVTNGVTPRRWLLACNPELAALYNEVVGKEWPLQLDKLRSVTKFADDKAFQQQFMTIKRHNKEKLVKVIKAETGIDVSSAEAIFDVQIKRLHEYKRQQLNLITSWRSTVVCWRTRTMTCTRGRSSSAPRRRPVTSWPRTSSTPSTSWRSGSTMTPVSRAS